MSVEARLKRAEDQARELPLSERERAEVQARLEARYTVLTDVRRLFVHKALSAAGQDVGTYESLEPSLEDAEEIRAHRRKWNLPRASEGTVDKAWAVLGDDTPERALADAQVWAGDWNVWTREQYVPVLEALRAKDLPALFALVMGKVQQDYARHHGSGGRDR